MSVVGRLDQYASMLAWEFDETTANNPSITGLGTYYSSEFNENVVDIVRDGLLLNVDAGNLSSYPGSGTTWTDLSGSGTVVNLSSTSYTTDAGGGIYFSSSASSAGFTATLNFSGGFTLETWIKHTGVVSTARVQRYMTISSSPLEGPVLRHNASTNASLHGYLFDSGSTFREIDVAGQILTNTYYHLVYTYDGTTFRLYKNNVQVGTLVATVTLPTIGTTHSLAPGGVEYFEGNMYVARYYNRGLTATEVSQNYNALATRFGLVTTNSTAPLSANIFPPYEPIYDEFGGTLYGAGGGGYMRQNTDRSVIVYNEIDEITDLFGRGVVRNGLVLDLDAGISDSYSGSGTTWTDLSPYSNNGTLVNSPTFLTDNSGVLDFDGSTQYASFAGSVNNFTVGTIECWCKPDAPTDNLNQQMVSRTNTSAGTFNLLKNTSNNFQFNIRLSTTTQYTIQSDVSATTNWTYVVGTYDGATQKIYVNASQQSSTTSISGTIDTAGTFDMNIGRNTGATAYFNGRIPIVRLYNRALTAEEILQNYNALKGRFGL